MSLTVTHLEVEDFMTSEESWSEQIRMVQRANPEASLVPMQFKNWLFLSQSIPRPCCGREDRVKGKWFPSTTVRFRSSNIQAQTQATGCATKSWDRPHQFQLTAKPPFVEAALTRMQFLIWHIYFQCNLNSKGVLALQTHYQ